MMEEQKKENASPPTEIEYHPLVIVGGGIGGLVLGLCLHRVYNVDDNEGGDNSNKPSLPIHIYESSREYRNDAGGAIGLYPNGLRVLRDMDPSSPSPVSPCTDGKLLANVREAGCDYLYRRWMRHDGTEVAVAREDELLPPMVVQKERASSIGCDGRDGSLSSMSSPSDDDVRRRSSYNLRESYPSDVHGREADARPRRGSFGSMSESLQRMVSFRGARSSGMVRMTSTVMEDSAEAAADDDGNGDDGAEEGGDEELKKAFEKSIQGGHTEAEASGDVKGEAAGEDGSLMTLLKGFTSAAIGGGGDKEGATARSSSATAATTATTETVDEELLSLGIRRWKFQKILHDACMEAGIHVHFHKRLVNVMTEGNDSDGRSTLLHFKDGTCIRTSLLIGADGINSKVRDYVTDPRAEKKEDKFDPEYTGVTCLMGCANVPRPMRGICFPSSSTTKCHACYYPTKTPGNASNGDANDDDDDESGNEQVFQIYFPSPVERPDTWKTLTPEEAKEECRELAAKLRADGWDEQFLAPLEHATLTGVLRVGLRSREALDVWHVNVDESESEISKVEGEGEGKEDSKGDSNDNSNKTRRQSLGRAVLLGDAAHPPVPYIGQGAMMAMEDAGTLAMLLRRCCPPVTAHDPSSPSASASTRVDLKNFQQAMHQYESLRVSRTKTVLGSSVQLGKTQQQRANSKLYNAYREWSIKAQVWAYGTLPVMRPGAGFDYRVAVEDCWREAEMEVGVEGVIKEVMEGGGQ